MRALSEDTKPDEYASISDDGFIAVTERFLLAGDLSAMASYVAVQLAMFLKQRRSYPVRHGKFAKRIKMPSADALQDALAELERGHYIDVERKRGCVSRYSIRLNAKRMLDLPPAAVTSRSEPTAKGGTFKPQPTASGGHATVSGGRLMAQPTASGGTIYKQENKPTTVVALKNLDSRAEVEGRFDRDVIRGRLQSIGITPPEKIEATLDKYEPAFIVRKIEELCDRIESEDEPTLDNEAAWFLASLADEKNWSLNTRARRRQRPDLTGGFPRG